MWNKIYNPQTGIKENLTSEIGINILRKYLIQLGGNNKPCAITYKPETKKNEKKNLKNEKYIIIEKLSQGGYDEIYLVKSIKNNKNYVLKVQLNHNKEYIMNELNALKELKDSNIIIKLHNAWNKDGFNFMIFEDLSPCQHNYKQMVKMVTKLIKQMHKKGWIHGDIHSGNVMCNSNNGKPVLINLGEAKKIKNLDYSIQQRLKQVDLNTIHNKEYFTNDYKDDIKTNFESYWDNLNLDLKDISNREMLI